MGAQRKTLRVLIVEDHAVFRQALVVFLEAQPDLEVAAQASSLAEARARLVEGGRFADIAVVDLGIAGGDAFVGELVGRSPGIAVLAVADRLDLQRRGLALMAGAGEVLTRGAGLGRILAALERLGER